MSIIVNVYLFYVSVLYLIIVLKYVSKYFQTISSLQFNLVSQHYFRLHFHSHHFVHFWIIFLKFVLTPKNIRNIKWEQFPTGKDMTFLSTTNWKKRVKMISSVKFSILYLCKRVTTIGIWAPIFRFISILAIITNVSLVIMFTLEWSIFIGTSNCNYIKYDSSNSMVNKLWYTRR